MTDFADEARAIVAGLESVYGDSVNDIDQAVEALVRLHNDELEALRARVALFEGVWPFNGQGCVGCDAYSSNKHKPECPWYGVSE